MMAARIGIVVIGRNEGERLVRCLESVCGQGRVVYVDSGSTDGSVARAREMGAEVVELEMSRPFTAARARNAGFARLRELESGVEFVQFVDGDCEVRDGWLAEGVGALTQCHSSVIVCGRLRERFPERSIYNRICDIGWDYPIGEIEACGGIAMYRADKYAAAGGFNESLSAGEEFEFCSRLRKAGGKVQRIDAEMAWHDVGITRFSQWWKRAVRSGFGSAEGCRLYDAQVGATHRRRVQRAVLWGALIPTILLLSAIIGIWWTAAWIGTAIVLTLWCLNFLRLYVRELRHRKNLTLAAWLAAFSMIGKLAEFRGAVEYGFRRARGQATRVIEYRGT